MENNQFEITIKTAELLKALAHPIRLEILERIGKDGAYVMDLYSWLGRAQANISQHLAILRAADLVIAEREGMTVKYTLKSSEILEFVGLVRKYAQTADVSITMRRGWRYGEHGRNFHNGRFHGGRGCKNCDD